MKLILGATDGIIQRILDEDDWNQEEANAGMSGFAMVCDYATPQDAAMIVHRFNHHKTLIDVASSVANSLREYRDGVWDYSDEAFDAIINALEREVLSSGKAIREITESHS